MTIRRWSCPLVLAVTLISIQPVWAQNSPPPVPPPPELGRPVPLPQRAPPTPLAYTPPPPPQVFPDAAVVQPSDPVLGGINPFDIAAATPGWFFGADVAVLFPTSTFRITTDQPLPTTNLKLDAPATSLDLTVSPTFEVGYRLPDAAGLFALSYGFVLASGSETINNGLGTLNVQNDVNIHWLDIDYGTIPYEIAPRWETAWRLGARVATINFKSSSTGPGGLTQTATSDYLGAGPHARFDIERRIVPVPGLSLFGRVDGTVYVGLIDQDFTLQKGAKSDTGSIRQTQTVPYLNLQAGLSYTPPAFPGFKITAGYLIEEYFRAGKLANEANGQSINSRGDFWSHGPFLRGQIDF